MVELAAMAAVVILTLNLVVATVMTWRRQTRDGWLPVILLGGTSMIAVVVVGTVVLPESALNRDRGVDVAVVVALMAAVVAAVPAVLARSAERRGPDSDARAEHDGELSDGTAPEAGGTR